MVHKKYSSAVSVALLLTAPIVAEVQLVRAQQAPTFKLPTSVAEGTNIRIDGSSSMAAVNEVLKQQFEQRYKDTQVNVAANGVPAGIKAVLDGQADLAAIGRPLNEQEKAQGLKAVPVGRDKIAILVGANNPFAKSITDEQFAKLFRGEVKNWSEVGGPSAPVKFVDRPDSSDTREAFKSYPVFKQAKFTTGATAEKLKEDTTQAVVSQLGKNGISYTTANQTKGLAGAKVVQMHGVSPTNPRYPFSQALYYVYKGDPSPAVQSFLGFATAPVGQKAIEQAGVATAIVPAATQVASNQKPEAKATAKKANGAAAKPATPANAQTAKNPQNGTAQAGGGNNPLAFLFPGGDTTTTGSAETGTGLPNWLWWLLPIGSGAALLWILGRGRGRSADVGATGSFNAPEYPAEDLPERDDRFTAPYVEGGFDPLQGDRDFSTDVDAPDRFDAGLDFNPNPDPNFDPAPTGGDRFGGDFGNLGGAALAGGAAAAGGTAAWSALNNRGKLSRVVLKARSPQEVEAFWDIPAEERQAIRQQGGEKLALRLYDVTDIDLETQQAHSVQQFDCDELTQRQRLPIALPDRDYLAEIGYLTPDHQWLGLARSTHVRVPASEYPSPPAQPTGTVDSTKPFLSEDRGVTPSEPAPPRESPSWFDRITHRVGDTASNVTQAGNSAARSDNDAVAGGAAAAAGAGAAAWSFLSGRGNRAEAKPTETTQSAPTETTQFVTGETAPVDTNPVDTNPVDPNPFAAGATESFISSVGEGRLVLTPRNSRWAYASWDIPRSLRSQIDRKTGENLVLRLYDVTDAGTQLPGRYEEHDIDDLALSCDVPISQADRTYLAEIGYVNANHDWIRLARSTPAHVPAS